MTGRYAKKQICSTRGGRGAHGEKPRGACAIRPLLLTRGAEGLVRRGHGDLHLGNIALIDGRPVPFDALEFDPLVASGDVLYDLAFLLMDLVERKLPEAANLVLNVYLGATRHPTDLDALAALPLFMSLRAAIRAKVTAARLANAASDQRQAIAAQAKAYFAVACDLITPPPPRLVAIGGLSGTGKSVLARALAPDLAPAPGAVLLRSDVERKAMFGVPENEKLPPEAFAADVGQRVYAALADEVRRVLAAGHSAIVDAVFARDKERAEIAGAARAHKVTFKGLFLSGTWRRGSPASAIGSTTHPMPTPRSRASRRATRSARSIGRRSMRPNAG